MTTALLTGQWFFLSSQNDFRMMDLYFSRTINGSLRLKNIYSTIVLLSIWFLTHICHAAEGAQTIPFNLDIVFEANAEVNQDDKGRASPIQVKFYELTTDDIFKELDYFSLRKNDKAALADSFVLSDVFMLSPNEKKYIKRISNEKTKVLVVVAGYQDLSNAIWNVVYSLPEPTKAVWYRKWWPKKKVRLNIELTKNQVLLTEVTK